MPKICYRSKRLTHEMAMPSLLECEVELRRAQVATNPAEWTKQDQPVIEAALNLAREKRIRWLLKRGFTQ